MASPADNSRLLYRASLWLTGLAWTLPFLQPYHRYPLTGFYSEWLAFALGLAAALALLTRAAWRGAAVPAVAFAPVALIAVLGAQLALGRPPYAEQGWIALLYLAWAALLIVLGRALGRMGTLEDAATTLAWFLLGGGMLAALLGLLQHFQVSSSLDVLVGRTGAAQTFGNLGQPNHFASYLSLALASCVYLYCGRRLHGAIASGCAALLLLLISLSASRSPWLYLAAFAALAAVRYVSSRDADSRRLVLITASLLPASLAAQWVAALPVMAPGAGGALTSVDRLFELAGGVDARLQLWGEAWDLFLTAPALGAGFGRFAWHHFLHQAQSGAAAAPGVFNHAHNVLMQLLAETGLVGAGCVGGALLLWVADLRRFHLDLAGWWLLASLAVLGVHSLLEFPLWYSYFLGIAALLLGLGAQRAYRFRFAGAARAMVGLLLLAGCANLIAVLPAYREFERLVFLPDAAASRLSDAAFTKAAVGLYREPLLVPYVELAIAYSVTVSDDRLADKIALTDRAVRFAPVPVVAYRHAWLLALAGARDAARIQLERALRVYPEDAGEAVTQLEALARARPDAFMPLLKLAKGMRAALPARVRLNHE